MVSKYLLLCDHCLQEIAHAPNFVDQPPFQEFIQVQHMQKGIIDEYHLHLDCLRHWASTFHLDRAARDNASRP